MTPSEYLTPEMIAELEEEKWSLLPDELVVFDTETTGLNAHQDRMIEIGAVLFNKNDYKLSGEVTTFQCFINPDRSIPKEATDINGITDEMVKGGETEIEALTKFFNFVGKRPLYAYNAKFDKDFIVSTAKRCGYYKTLTESLLFEVNDIYNLAREFFTELPNLKLTTIAQNIGIENLNSHRAIGDSVIALKVLVHIKQSLFIKDNISAILEIERLKKEIEEKKKRMIELEDEKDLNKNKSCFVATAAYQNINHPNVDYLRWYRDSHLMPNKFGKMFITIYYIVGPLISIPVKKYQFINKITRKIINRIVILLKNNY